MQSWGHTLNNDTHTQAKHKHSPESLQFVLELGLDGSSRAAHLGQGLSQLHLVLVHGCGLPPPGPPPHSPGPAPLPPVAATHVFVSRCDTNAILLLSLSHTWVCLHVAA